jgi:hypothetical protein
MAHGIKEPGLKYKKEGGFIMICMTGLEIRFGVIFCHGSPFPICRAFGPSKQRST